MRKEKESIEFEFIKKHLELTSQYIQFWMDKDGVFTDVERLQLILLSKVVEQNSKDFSKKIIEEANDGGNDDRES